MHLVIGFRCLLLNLVLGLFILIPSLSFSSNTYTESSKNSHLSHQQDDDKSKIDFFDVSTFEVSQVIGFSEWFGHKIVGKIQFLDHLIYTSKLLYLDISDLIVPNLTTTDIIFPFHCFT